MTNHSGPPAPGRASAALQTLIGRIAAADLDPVQIASMDLHLSHVLRLRKDGTPTPADTPNAVIGGVSPRRGEDARN